MRKSIANAMRIRSVPTMMNYKNGMGEYMITGGDEAKIKKFFECYKVMVLKK